MHQFLNYYIYENQKNSCLLKQKFTLLLNNEKWSRLNLVNISYGAKKKGPGGRLLMFLFDKKKRNLKY